MTTVKKVTSSIFKSLNETANPTVVKESYSEEIARELFVSLIKLGYGAYSILNDGYFVEKIYADSDDEAIKKFYEIIKKRKTGPMVYPEDEIDAAEDGDVIQYTEGVGIKLKDIGVVLVEGTLNAQKPIKSQVEALNVAEYKRSLKLAKTVSESIVLKRIAEAVSLDEVADKLNAAGVFAKNIVNKGLNLAADGTQYGVQLVGEKDGQVKVAVVAKRGGKLLDLTSKANADDVTKTILSLLNKTGEPSKKKSIFMKADEAVNALPINLTIYLDDDIFTRDYKTIEEAKAGMEKWAYANLEDFEFEEVSNTPARTIWSIDASSGTYTAIATVKGKEANEAVELATESSSRFNSIKPDQYYIVVDYFKQYALGATGTSRSNTIYISNNNGDGFSTKREAALAANNAGIKRLRKNGKDTPYGELGAETVDVSIVIGKQIIESYRHYDIRVLPKSANETIDPKQLKTIKDMIRDYLYYGETLDTFIAQDYPIARGISKDELRTIWRECMSELEEL